jgi:hypothetical protein
MTTAEVLNLAEHDCESTHVRHLVAGDLLCGWTIVDDESTLRWVGLPIQTGDGNRARIAYCKDDAGAAQTITCYLDKDATGTEITVHCFSAQGNSTNLNACIPRLKDGDPMMVQKVRYDDGSARDYWVCTTVFQPSEDCPCS